MMFTHYILGWWSHTYTHIHIHTGTHTRRLLTLSMVVTQRLSAHVAQSYGAFTAAVDERVAVDGMKLGGGDHLRQLLHVSRLDIYYVCTTVKDANLTSIVTSQTPCLHSANSYNVYTNRP